ncbi:hypothetical protein TNCV_2725111 [Trichonephila clavipes]|nr:hypothetical protein TNCV_2725111 [Trichonephila clavipes]
MWPEECYAKEGSWNSVNFENCRSVQQALESATEDSRPIQLHPIQVKVTNLIILNHAQVTRMRPELKFISPNFRNTPMGGRFRSTNFTCNPHSADLQRHQVRTLDTSGTSWLP